MIRPDPFDSSKIGRMATEAHEFLRMQGAYAAISIDRVLGPPPPGQPNALTMLMRKRREWLAPP